MIWACGYHSNAIKIHDVNKKELKLSQKIPGTQFDVDGKNRIMLADGNVLLIRFFGKIKHMGREKRLTELLVKCLIFSSDLLVVKMSYF